MKNRRNILTAILLLAIVFVSCDEDQRKLRMALNISAKAKVELTKVLDHYKDDPEKLAAAKFLISNMPAHRSYYGEIVDQFNNEALGILKSEMSPEEQHDSIMRLSDSKYYSIRKHQVLDILLMKSEYLINNIDQAFYQWKNQPWSKHLTFDEFCEWLLPYKVAEHQFIDNWRDTVMFHFSDTLSTFPIDDKQMNTVYYGVDAVRTEIVNKIHPRVIWGVHHGYSLYSSELLPHWTYGTCEEYVSLGVMTFRSLGFPAVIDQVPVWGRKNLGHTWYTILSDNGREVTSPDCIISPLGWNFYPYERFPKVFRSTYSYNTETYKYNQKSKFNYPINVCQIDVTDKYFLTSDIEIPVDKKKLKDKYVYISMLVNNGQPEWSIIDYGHYRHGKAFFKKMGRNNMYIVMGYNGSSLSAISDPFILDKDGSIRYIHPSEDNLISLDLKRKYFETYNVVTMRNRVLGGEIQCSDNSSFLNAKTLFSINNVDTLNSILNIKCDESYRYWRYMSPNGSYGCIAELSFMDSLGNAIKGKPIANEEAGQDAIERAFDGNYLSNFEINQPDGNWVGKDFGSPTKVSKLSIIPRTDDNDIYPGQDYELKWWNGDYWLTIDRKVATSNTIHFDSIPQGALLWLKNHTRGIDERAFVINDNGEIEWW